MEEGVQQCKIFLIFLTGERQDARQDGSAKPALARSRSVDDIKRKPHGDKCKTKSAPGLRLRGDPGRDSPRGRAPRRLGWHRRRRCSLFHARQARNAGHAFPPGRQVAGEVNASESWWPRFKLSSQLGVSVSRDRAPPIVGAPGSTVGSGRVCIVSGPA